MKINCVTLTTALLLGGCSEEKSTTANEPTIVEQAAQIIVDEHQEKKERAEMLGQKQMDTVQKQRIAQAINEYLIDSGMSTPSYDFELDTLLLASSEGGGPNGPYLSSSDSLIDPWGNKYFILVPGEGNSAFDIDSQSDR